MEAVKKSVKLIEKYRGRLENYDIVYTVDYPEEPAEQKTFSEECRSSGVTWILDHLYGLRISAEKAMEKVKKGPPKL